MFQDKDIVLGITGGIAAYKMAEVASRLTQMGASVHVVMTEGAQKFIAPLTFAALTHNAVHTSLWPETLSSDDGVYSAMAHIGLADKADAILVAPASADIIAKLAGGHADDLITTLVLATRAPVLVSPAMNPQMLEHPATQRNLQTLMELGYLVIEPETGRMACEHVGSGRLPATEVLIDALGKELIKSQIQDLAGKTVLVTAGPTREAIDPVRFISNRSSGKMGYAIAAECARRGAKVTLVSGPTKLKQPHCVTRIDVVSTDEMFEVSTREAQLADIVIAAAAPADYRPPEVVTHKLKKSTTENAPTLALIPTPDILAAIGKAKRAGQVVIGFAAETENLLANARYKLGAKNCDAVVANDVTQSGAGFDIETNRVTWVTHADAQEWPLLTKSEVASRICAKVAELLVAKNTTK
ncbi:MAG TPA: bifunctional phosphopantothenoylcysteine decarboxylase/phosphopantothenate--cysteine ligase CoaBC [Abditibacteriaceae bacterium]